MHVSEHEIMRWGKGMEISVLIFGGNFTQKRD